MLTLFLQSGLPLPHKSQRHPHPIEAQRSFAFLTRSCHFPSPTGPKRPRDPFPDFVLFVYTSGQGGARLASFPGVTLK